MRQVSWMQGGLTSPLACFYGVRIQTATILRRLCSEPFILPFIRFPQVVRQPVDLHPYDEPAFGSGFCSLRRLWW